MTKNSHRNKTKNSHRNKTAVDRVGSAFLRALVRRMKELGLNQSALARRMNVSRAYVSKVMQGDAHFTFASAAHFCRALKLDFIPTVTPQGDPSVADNAEGAYP